MTQPLFDLCLNINFILGPLAWVALSYRAVIGRFDQKIVYWPLFVIFIGYVGVTALGPVTSKAVGNQATYLAVILALLNLALLVVCTWMPGPLRKEPKL